MPVNHDIVALIPARGGSKGVHRKNIRLLGGKPLIGHAIQSALESRLINRVVVSTDDQEIMDIAEEYGAEVPFLRPRELATDDSPEWLTWQHAIRTLDATEEHSPMLVLVCVPPTAPLRSSSDIDRCIDALLNSDADVVITVTPASRSPYFNMVTLAENGQAQLAISPDGGLHGAVHRRQDAPELYDMATVAYVARPDFVLRADSLFDGNVMAVVVPKERALDIDTELDFEIAEFMISRAGGRTTQ
jgi:N-acylneuraminate cytidylyltransferase